MISTRAHCDKQGHKEEARSARSLSFPHHCLVLFFFGLVYFMVYQQNECMDGWIFGMLSNDQQRR
jgi:hypothetical protein